MEIEILGPGCRNCVDLEARTREAAAGLGLDPAVAKVTDMAEIAAHGVMRTPALVVDGEVLVSGRVPTVAQVRELLAARAAR